MVLPSANSQIVPDGATNTLSNVTNTINGNVVVGTNGSFTLLVLSDNTLLTNSVNGILGRNGTAKSNEVQLISSTARWRMGGSLFVGSNGASSRLVVSNGALLEDFNGNLGFLSASSNNSALVTGAGSLWTNNGAFSISGAFFSSSKGNQVVVSNGAALVAVGGSSVEGSGNQVVVTGAGSRWASQSSFSFGGGPNRLDVTDGAALVSSNATIADLVGSGDTTVLLTGTGTVWSNTAELQMGYGAARGVLTVSNGASAYLGGAANIGVIGNSNVVSVTDPGTSCTIGSDLVVGGAATANLLAISNGGFVVNSNAFIGGPVVGASGNSALVTGAGSVWSNQASLYIGAGDYVYGNQMIVSSGARVLSSNALIGASTNLANNNFALISDSGTLWSNRTQLTVGNFGFSNQFVVSNGATYVGTGTAIGANASAGSNSVVVTGAQSRWTNTSIFYVGSNGPANHLTISNGGLVKSFGGYLGHSSTSTNNEVVVTGPGSVWIPSGLSIGDSGYSTYGYGGNHLVISNGGWVNSGFTSIGTLSSNNEVVVTGPGSLWTDSDRVFLGYGLGPNRIVITNAGGFFSQGIIIGGDTPLSTNNRVVVDGGTLQVTNTLPLTVLGAGVLEVRHGTNVLSAGLIDVDQLLLTNALGFFEFKSGTLITRSAFISNGPFSIGTTNSGIWNAQAGLHVLTSSFYLGGDAFSLGTSSNQLLITNGATFDVPDLTLGFFTSNNQVRVSSPGSTLNSPNGLYIANHGQFNRVTIDNGGHVFGDAGATVGGAGDARSNAVVVADPGSRFSSSAVHLGLGGSGSQLVVSNGALVDDLTCAIGETTSASNNLAIVTGAGSFWSNAIALYVGYLGPGNSLVVSNGGVVFASNTIAIGADTLSTNNRVTVDGSTLRVTNASATGLLEVRRGTFTLNSGLVEVDQLLMTNQLATFMLKGGTLSVKSSTVTNTLAPHVGDGTNAATLFLAGNGTHTFNGLIVSSNGTLAGNGTLNAVATLNGATISPGASIGKIVLTSSPILGGIIFMEISKNGATLTNDLIQMNPLTANTLTYDGVLTVTNLGPTPLAAGDRFQLFSASGYFGSFTTISLPPLAAGLAWTNKLLVDGSIEVILSQPGERFWTNVAGGSYNVAANWLSNALPAPQDNANFTSNASYQVDWPASALTANAVFNAGGGVVTQAIGAFTWTITNSYVLARDSLTAAEVAHTTGTLRVTNSQNTARLIVGQSGHGTFDLAGGEVVTDTLLATNGAGSIFNFISGTLRTRNSTVVNGSQFIVGNGASTAIFELLGNRTNTFADGLTIQSQGVLTGNGTVSGPVTVQAGALLSPGAGGGALGGSLLGLGKISCFNSPSLQGATLMEISHTAGIATNDQLQVFGSLTYSGTLTVTNIGTNALMAGDRFQLFNATGYAGSFTSLDLPPLGPGLNWKTNLLVDGSLEVFTPPAIPLSRGSYAQNFDSLNGASSDLWRDNSTLLGWYAAKSTLNPITIYRASDGSDATGSLYSFGSAGSPERALGSIASDSFGDVAYGLCFTNDTDNSVSNFMITYAGEQWRVGGSGNVANTLSFWYRVSPAVITNPEPSLVANWTQVTNLDFVSPTLQGGGTSGSPLDGNLPPNRQLFSSVLLPGLIVPPGQHVFFRWRDLNDAGPDEGISLDDLTISFAPLSPPVPPQITSVSLNPANRSFQLSGQGEPNATYTIEAASNLVSPIFWQSIGSNTANSNGLFQFTDTNAPAFPLRFYRALFP